MKASNQSGRRSRATDSGCDDLRYNTLEVLRTTTDARGLLVLLWNLDSKHQTAFGSWHSDLSMYAAVLEDGYRLH